jgi:hypothetical protein
MGEERFLIDGAQLSLEECRRLFVFVGQRLSAREEIVLSPIEARVRKS